MKKIIALQGRHDTGKSSTLRKLRIDFLLKNGYIPVDGKYEERGNVDFVDVFEKNGKLIGITSAGDNYELVNKRVKLLIEINCTIIICACRTRGKSVQAIQEFSEFQSEFVEKSIASMENDYEIVNEKDARKLFDRVEDAVISNIAA